MAVDAEALVAGEPWRERRWAILALARYRCGRQADALESIRVARRTLAEQLGLDPSPELAALELSILRQDPALAAPPEPPSVSETCPYKGLVPYAEGDAESFFGRDAEVAACLERLRTSSLLVLAGPSGCGKSSLLRAGILPALQQRGADPGGPDARRPIPDAAWTAAVASVDPAAPVLVDQFEELFAVGDVPVVSRAPRRARPQRAGGARGPQRPPRPPRRRRRLQPPRRARPAPRQPARRRRPAGGDRAAGAARRPARRARPRRRAAARQRGRAGCAPAALARAGRDLEAARRERADGRRLPRERRDPRGGRAVGRPALRQPRPRAARASCARSCCGSSRRRSTAIRCAAACPAASLLGDPGRERVVALLVRSRLVTAEEDTFELAHEALARAWPRLQAWLDEDAAGQRILRHLGAAADGWDSLGPAARASCTAARGSTRRSSGVTPRSPDLTALERAFLDASVRCRIGIAGAGRRARRDARQNRRLRALLAAAVVAARRRGRRGRRRARRPPATPARRRPSALHEALVNRSLALRGTNRSVAALLAVEAYRRRPDARAWSALLGTFTADPTFLGYHYVPGRPPRRDASSRGPTTAVVALDGRRLAATGPGERRARRPLPAAPTPTPSRTRCCASAPTAASSRSSSRRPIAAMLRSGAAADHRRPRLRGVLRLRDRQRAARAGPGRAPVRPGRHRASTPTARSSPSRAATTATSPSTAPPTGAASACSPGSPARRAST